MAGSATITYETADTVRAINVAWTSDSSGDMNVGLTKHISGQLLRVVTVPGTGGNQPSANYSASLVDEQGRKFFGKKDPLPVNQGDTVKITYTGPSPKGYFTLEQILEINGQPLTNQQVLGDNLPDQPPLPSGPPPGPLEPAPTPPPIPAKTYPAASEGDREEGMFVMGVCGRTLAGMARQGWPVDELIDALPRLTDAAVTAWRNRGAT